MQGTQIEEQRVMILLKELTGSTVQDGANKYVHVFKAFFLSGNVMS